MLQNFLWVALGGALGSCGRYGVSVLLNSKTAGFPYGTFTVNLLGSLILGILLAASFWDGDKNLGFKLFLTTGLMGGFTTYSTFSYETMDLLRQGHVGTGVSYLCATLFICLFASMAGFWLGRQIF
jgi:fluoride exporter